MLELQDFRAARRAIFDHMRLTPVFAPKNYSDKSVFPDRDRLPDLYLKLENMQISGSFKARGAMNAALALDEDKRANGLCTASGMAYIHPFADPRVIAGQGTIALEMLEQQADLDTLVVAIGGGGLISGVATAAKMLRPSIRVIGVEPTGAPTLFESLKNNTVATLPSVNTAATSLAPRQSSALNVDLIGKNVDRIALVSDDEMRDAARWLWRELGLSVELSAAAGIAAILTGRLGVENPGKIGVIICGTGADGMS